MYNEFLVIWTKKKVGEYNLYDSVISEWVYKNIGDANKRYMSLGHSSGRYNKVLTEMVFIFKVNEDRSVQLINKKEI